MKLCINCIHYHAGISESEDKCHHEQSTMREDFSVRTVNIQVKYFNCAPMLHGICRDHKLFEQKPLSAFVEEATAEVTIGEAA